MSRLIRTLRLLPILALPALAGCVAYAYDGDGAPGSYVQSAPAYFAPPVYVPPPVIIGGYWGPRSYYGGYGYRQPGYGYGHGRGYGHGYGRRW